MNIRTSEYIVLEEMKREKIRIRTGQRALSFEEVIRESIDPSKGMSKGKGGGKRAWKKGKNI